MGGFAWVTLATNDSYSLGALVLAHSLRRAGTKHDLAVLITPGVTQVMRDKLATVFSLVQEVNVLDSKEEANLALLARPELGITFTKLHCWRLTQYEKCVFIDADALVIRNCDELFEREELSAAPDVGWPDCFNSGVFVFRPSQQTFASITAFAAEKGSFDGGDQGLLNSYFSDWAHKDIAKHLPFIYNMCSTATYSYLPAYKQYGENARIIHFIGATKPWLQYFDTETGVVHPPSGCHHLQPLLQLWWNIFCENVHSQLSPVMARSTLAPIWHRFTPSFSGTSAPSYPIYDDSSHFSSHRSEQVKNDDDDYNFDDYNIRPADFSEFNDPWEQYIPKSTPMENIFFHQQELYTGEQYYDDIEAGKQQLNEKDNYRSYQSIQVIGQSGNENRDENQVHLKSDDSYHDLKNEENYRLQGGFEAGVNETDYIENINLEEINDRLQGELINDHESNDVESFPPRDHGQTDDPAQYSISQSLSREPCTDPLHNVAQHNEQSVDSQGHLATEDAGIAGALAKMTLGEPRSGEQTALEEHMRRQGWEQGQIDYMGRDSFDNIWKKICVTLNQAPESESSPPKEEETSEIESSLVPDVTPVAEPSPTAATKTEAETDSPRPSEDPAVTILPREIQPLTPETIDQPTAQDQSKIPAEAKEESAQPEEKSTVLEKIDATTKETPLDLQSLQSEPVPQSPAEPEEIIAPKTPEADSISDVKVEQFISTFEGPPVPEVLAEPVDQSTKSASELSEFILDSSSVPIQVAESVLQSEPKESVSEDQRPVSEEAVSSVVAPVLEAVTAVSETVQEPKEQEYKEDEGKKEDSVLPPASTAQKIDNGIDTAPQAAPKPEKIEPEAKEAVPIPQEEPKAASITQEEPKASPIPQEEPKAASITQEEPKASPIPQEEPKAASITQEEPKASPIPQEEPKAASITQEEPKASPIPQEEPKAASITQEEPKASPIPQEEPKAASITQEEPKASPIPQEEPKAASITQEEPKASPIPQEEPKAASITQEEPKASPITQEEPKAAPVTQEEPKAAPVTQEEPKAAPVTQEEPKAVPVTQEGPKAAEASIEEAEPEDEPSSSAVSESSKSASLTPPDSPSTQGPVRPARTRDPRVPTTPIVTEATPPNSPPIGPGQSLDDPPKTVKKVVKKVVKKASVDSESGDVGEGEVAGKKVVKKVIKKVVKKPKEAEDGAEASGTAIEKPKKVVKVVKKIAKPSESLEVDQSVPETPPAGVPVPPKRKTKTTTTTTTKVTTTKNVPAESKPSESEP